jgi:hypothetical protein
MTTVTAKVRCASKEVRGEGENRMASVAFSANYSDAQGNRVNEEWSLATPHLSVSMTLNGAAADLFEQGRNYTLVFEPEE